MEIETEALTRETLEALVSAHQQAFDRIQDSYGLLMDRLSKVVADQTPTTGDDLVQILSEWLTALNAALSRSSAEVSAIVADRDMTLPLN